MPWAKRFSGPFFEESTDPTIIVIPGATPAADPEPAPGPDHSLLIGQMTEQLKQLAETVQLLKEKTDRLESEERWTETRFSDLWSSHWDLRNQVEETLEEPPAEEPQPEEEPSAEMPEGIPAIPPQIEQPNPNPEPETNSGFWNLKNWI